jgi:hypothetical protein
LLAGNKKNVKFANNPPVKNGKKAPKGQKAGRSKAQFLNAPRETADYDVEDMEDSSDHDDKENTSSMSETQSSENYDSINQSLQSSHTTS